MSAIDPSTMTFSEKENWIKNFNIDKQMNDLLGNSSSDGLLGGITGSDTYKDIFGKDTGLMGALGQGFNIYSSIKQMGLMDDYVDMMKEQLGMKKEQWGITKNQLANMERYGNQVGYGYTHGGDYNSASNPYYQEYGANNSMVNTGANSMANQAAYQAQQPAPQPAPKAQPVWNNQQTLLG
jgi:hypothetical protein